MARTVRIGKAIADDFCGKADDFNMLTSIQHQDILFGRVLAPVLHDRPVPLRMTASERERHARYASRESRSASNFALKLYRMGMQQYEQQMPPLPQADQAR